MFHVDRFSQTEPVLGFRLFWLHVSHAPAENLEVGVLFIHRSMGSDLSQPTSTSLVLPVLSFLLVQFL